MTQLARLQSLLLQPLAASCAVLLAGTVFATHHVRPDVPLPSPALATLAQTPIAAPSAQVNVQAAAPALAIKREGTTIRIAADAASRWEAARQLAALTHVELLGQPEALADAPPITLHWQGRDVQAAWAALLGDETSHALQCDAAGCKVWVFAVGPATLPAARVALARVPDETAEAEPPRLFPVQEF
jgi:hypothetical protein